MQDEVLRIRPSTNPSGTLLLREWLVTNGLGGYASGTIAGVATSRYHSLLIAALPTPLGRVAMFNHLSELLRLPDGRVVLFGKHGGSGGHSGSQGADYLVEFRLEAGLPVWRYEIAEYVVEKRIIMPHLQNTTNVRYTVISGDGEIRLKLRPSVHFRRHDAAVTQSHPGPYTLMAVNGRYELSSRAPFPTLRMLLHGSNAAFTVEEARLANIHYQIEESRGYEYTGDLWSPGYFRMNLSQDNSATLVASTEAWDVIEALHPESIFAAERERRGRLVAAAHPELQQWPVRQLVYAADQFIVVPTGRAEDAARARATGDELRTVIAGYHWFTDWGRDTMISLEGLTLLTGRHEEAGYILRTFNQYVRDGLIPNMFPEGENEGRYHTADATLWFFHAIHRYLRATNDRNTLRLLLPTLSSIVAHHQRGTRFNIGVDPNDGLLRAGAEGYQLTWMDAKVDDWVVTPRRGKPVEINALWYNALCLLAAWEDEEGSAAEAKVLREHAVGARQAFNKRFWYEAGGYLYDVVDGPDGDDAACRPNQIFAISLPHPILDSKYWRQVHDVVRARLLTPFGLRSLAAGHPAYKAKYFGDLRSRDAAYHQGTIWAWLIGPFIDAWSRVHPADGYEPRRFLTELVAHLSVAGIGTVSEIFDADPPFTPRGCIAQAWSVAEVIRCWVKTFSSDENERPYSCDN